MVGTYDGDPLGIGRVVVDSTWHHWFSLNLAGLRDLSPDVYAGMQDYYINIALWLSTPGQRASMLFAATWDALVASQPGAFDVALGIRGIGERVVDVIGRSAPQCIFDELVATTAELPAARTTTPADDRWWLWAPSGSSLNTAIVGGIASRMIKQAHHHINEETRGQEPRLDADAVRRLGLEGVAAGKHELVEGLSQGSERFAVMRDLLVEHGDRTSLGGTSRSMVRIERLGTYANRDWPRGWAGSRTEVGGPQVPGSAGDVDALIAACFDTGDRGQPFALDDERVSCASEALGAARGAFVAG